MAVHTELTLTPEDSAIWMRLGRRQHGLHGEAALLYASLHVDREDAVTMRLIAYHAASARRMDVVSQPSPFVRFQRLYYRAPECDDRMPTEPRAGGWHP